MTWFEDWFNSPYYHILYKNRDYKEAQNFIDNLINYLQIPKQSKLLDIGCGKGRHAIYFSNKGMDVVGFDLSQNNINTAKKYENKTLKFFVHDMRKTFKENTFDIATNLFTSFGYFENNKEEQKSINKMVLNLKKEGILIIDFMNSKKAVKELIESEKKEVEGLIFNIQRRVENKYIIKTISFSHSNKKHQFQEKVKILTLAEFSKFITNAGMKIIDIFGDYKLNDFNAINSERLIIICKK